MKSVISLTILVLIFCIPSLSAWTSNEKPSSTGGAPTLSEFDQDTHDINQVTLVVTNQGYTGDGFFPTGTHNNYSFGSGLWIGAKYDADDDGDLDKVFSQAYNPLASDSEFREGRGDQNLDDPLARVFDSTDPDDLADWPAQFCDPTSGSPLDRPIVLSDQDLVTTYTTKDRLPLIGDFQLPVEINQRSLAFRAGLTVQAIIFIFDLQNWGEKTLQDTWIGHDSDMDIGVAFGDDQTGFIENWQTPEGDTISVNMGLAWDSDFSENNFVGHPGFVGIVLLRSPGVPNDGIDNDGDGLIDESPFNDLDDDGDGDIDEADEVDELGLVNYSKHCNPSVPCALLDPMEETEGYDMLACDSDDSDVTCLESIAASDIRFMMSSGPFDWEPGQSQQVVLAMIFANATGDPDHLDFVGDPPRPDPNDPALSELMFVWDVFRGFFEQDFKQLAPPLPNLTLVPGDRQVTLLWDDLPVRTPDEGYDVFVELDPEYRQYDFQGFRVWRSRTGSFSHRGDVDHPDYPLTPEAKQENEQMSGMDLTLLAQYDLADGITSESHGISCYDSVILLDESVVYTDCDTFNLGNDTGLSFSYLDRGEVGTPLINGYRYYYTVTAYDYNSDALAMSRLSLDSGVSFSLENSTIPRSQASSYMEALASILHVNESGEVLDDTSSIFASPQTGELDPLEAVHASNALVNFSFNSGFPDRVSDDYYTLVLDEFEKVDNTTNLIHYYVEDAAGVRLNTSAVSSFSLVYDGTDQTVGITVFDPDDSSKVIFSSDLTFNVDSDHFLDPDPAIHFLAENSFGDDIVDSLGSVSLPPADAIPAGFRAGDLRMEWVGAGMDSLTLEVTDLDNLVEIPFGEGVVDSAYHEVEGEEGSNWSFLSIGAGAVQPGGRYFMTNASAPVIDLWMSGTRITVAGMRRMPLAGDVWTLRQLAYTMEIDTTVTPNDTTYHDMLRPPVPGTRYRIDTVGGGVDRGSIDMTKIRVVPNPVSSSARFSVSCSSSTCRPSARSGSIRSAGTLCGRWSTRRTREGLRFTI
jgi:hypothetical protein